MTYAEIEAKMMQELDRRDWCERFWESERDFRDEKDFSDPYMDLFLYDLILRSERDFKENVEVYPRDFDMRYVDED